MAVHGNFEDCSESSEDVDDGDEGFLSSRVHSILDTMMPKQVVREIAENPDVPLPSHKYRLATIVQADLVGFTEMAASREPDEVVRLIEQIFKIFDDLTDFLAIYKIETVGDAYIAGMAEP
ncbi:gcy-23, partial [Symbiodinium microadriaticum]